MRPSLSAITPTPPSPYAWRQATMGASMPSIRHRIINCREDEEHVVRRLGKAVVAQWSALPEPVRDRLLQQATCIHDKSLTVQVEQQIEAFIKKNQGEAG